MKQKKTHLKPALGASSAAPGVVHYQQPVIDTRNGGAADSHNVSSDQGGSREAFRVAKSRPGTRGSAVPPR